MFYALAHSDGLRQYLGDTVNLFIALGPVTQMGHHKSILLWTLQLFEGFLWWFDNKFGWYEWAGEVD